jgi:N6-L-threonylcarbamoyladenine synthase
VVEHYAKTGNPKTYKLPRPLTDTHIPNFSFSGLKTAVLRCLETNEAQNIHINPNDLCASFQMAITDCFLNRMQIAMHLFKEKTGLNHGHCVIAGGVAANMFIRTHLETLCKDNNFDFFAPPLKYCTDNGVMIAYAGLQRFLAGHISPLDYQAKARSPLG